MNLFVGFGAVLCLFNAVTTREVVELYDKDINGTLSSDSLSKFVGVVNIRVFAHGVKKIEDGAFCSQPTVRYFSLDLNANRDPFVFTKDTFKNCENLEGLYLGGNNRDKSTLRPDALHHLTNLKELSVKDFNMKNGTRDYFKGLSSLTKLTLHFCHTEGIHPGAFDDLKSLERLYIDHTPIGQLPSGLFKNTPKLRRLSLRDDGIAGLTWDEFEGLTALQNLYLSDNRIDAFDAEKIAKNMPNLKRLAIEKNPVSTVCKEQEDFLNALPKLTSVNVTYKFYEGYDSCLENM